jgi:Ser/Thr protein kinase RdoA (MazF antagonist)
VPAATGRFWGDTPPATPVSPDEAAALASELFGVTGTARPLGSNQETNLLLRAAGGERYVLKVANPAFGAEVLDLQNRAMQHVAAAGTGLAVPLPMPARDGSHLVVAPVRGAAHHVRLLTFVAGEMFSDAEYLSDEALAAFGALAARLAGALADFDDPAADRLLQYDSQHARGVVETLAASVADPVRRAGAVRLSDAAWQRWTRWRASCGARSSTPTSPTTTWWPSGAPAGCCQPASSTSATWSAPG